MPSTALQCIICTGQPRFSDMSHLLTHVASKAHLSNCFKLKVRSYQEPKAVDILDEYDRWYRANDLDQLLSDRMASKDDRKKKKAERRASNGTKAQSTKQQLRNDETADASACPTPSTYYLDPRLADSSEDANHELDSMETSPNEHHAILTAPTTDAITASFEDYTRPLKQTSKDLESHGWLQTDRNGSGPAAALPMTPKQRRNRQFHVQGPSSSSEDVSDPFVDGVACSEVLDDAEFDKVRADEIARLKGVLWPGMDVFDSATHQMRRMRNQKKDDNVLKSMEATSLCVEPAEFIFSPSGTFQKQREITGNVEDDSPVKGETPIPRPRPARPRRGLLRQADPNVPRRDRKRTRKGAFQDHDRDGEELVEQNQGSPLPIRRHRDPVSSYSGYDGELSLSIQAFGARPRSAFTVFSDADRDEPNSKGHHAGPKSQLGTLTPARLVLDRKAGSVSYSGSAADHVAIGKENIEPILNPQGRIGLSAWPSPFPKHRDSHDAEYVPRYFYEEPGVELASYEDHDKYGYRCNPLLAPTSKLALIENLRPEENATGDHGAWQPVSRAVSSEGTISEEDLDRLYLDSSAN